MGSLDARFLKPRILEITTALAKFGFITDTVVGDGASENRSVMRQLATLTAKDLFGGDIGMQLQNQLPMEKKIAFRHPTLVSIIIFIGGDMPHWIKKFVNCLERSGKTPATTLRFDGKNLSLKMCQDVWEVTGDACRLPRLRMYRKLGHEHFDKNPYNRMRTFLAAQICSMTMVRIIDENAEECGGRDKYASLRRMLIAVDRLIDICNATQKSGPEIKGAGPIDSAHDPQLRELLEILALFTEWQREGGEYSEQFITRQSYEDLVWMVFGFVGVAKYYLLDSYVHVKTGGNGSGKWSGVRAMFQRWGGTDVCEHHFANVRGACTNPNAQMANRAGGVGSCNTTNEFDIKTKSNTSGAMRPTSDQYMAGVTKKRSRK